jgi:hypothetical protein
MINLEQGYTDYYPNTGLNRTIYLDFKSSKPPLEYRESIPEPIEIKYHKDYDTMIWSKPKHYYLVYKLKEMITSHSAIYEFYRIED